MDHVSIQLWRMSFCRRGGTEELSCLERNVQRIGANPEGGTERPDAPGLPLLQAAPARGGRKGADGDGRTITQFFPISTSLPMVAASTTVPAPI